MFGLPILRRYTPIRVEQPKCKGSLYGCDDKEQPKLKSALRLAQMAGNHYSILISSDWERIITWGSTPSYGSTGVNAISNKPQTAVINWKDRTPQSIINVKSFGGSAYSYTLFKTQNNQLYGTGYNSNYILNKSNTGIFPSFELITEDVLDYSIGIQNSNWETSTSYMVYAKTDGKLYGLGPSSYGYGFPLNQQKALTIDDGKGSNYLGITDVNRVFCSNTDGYTRTYIIKNDSTAMACGYNYKGCLGVNSVSAIEYEFQTVKRYNGSTYVPLTGIKDIVTTNFVYGGGANTNATVWAGGSGPSFMGAYFLTQDGSVYTCGSNKFGRLGLGLTSDENTTRNYAIKTSLTGVVSICTGAGGSSILAVTSANDVYSWGNNQWGQLGLGDTTDRISPTKVTFPNKEIKMIHGGGSYGIINGAFLIVCTDGTVYGAGFNQTYALGLTIAGTNTPDAGPITTFRQNEFFGPNPTQNQDPQRYPLLLSGSILSGDTIIRNAELSAVKSFTIGGTTFSDQVIYVQQNMSLSGYGIQPDTIVKAVDYNTHTIFLNKPLTATADTVKLRYDQRIRVYQADLCGYGTEMAQKIVTEDGTLYMSGWNQNVSGIYNFNYYYGDQNVAVPTYFDAKFR
jgi:alpha-tubulin suppressor-like RCC1 family protein